MVQAMGRYLLDHVDELAQVLTLEQGKPLWGVADRGVDGAARYISEYYGNRGCKRPSKGARSRLAKTTLISPRMSLFGVSAQIIPWNYPR